MKIEKISENQIKCILSQKDLIERQIRVDDLALGSKNAKTLFNDLMAKAFTEFGFDISDTPIMVEAIPVNNDNIMLIITKINDEAQDQEGSFSDLAFDVSKKNNSVLKNEKAFTENEKLLNAFYIYKFKDLAHISSLSKEIGQFGNIKSSLYRDDSSYILLLECFSISRLTHYKLKGFLAEYGEYISNRKSMAAYYDEHFETLVRDKAIERLMLI